MNCGQRQHFVWMTPAQSEHPEIVHALEGDAVWQEGTRNISNHSGKWIYF